METKKFTMKDEAFKCLVCGYEVSPLKITARDHCPNCLSSIHIDNNPGDRSCNCLGILKPIDILKDKKDSLKIVYKCTKCGVLKKNKTAPDDNFDLILEVMKNKN